MTAMVVWVGRRGLTGMGDASDLSFRYAADTLMRCVVDLRLVSTSVREGTIDGLDEGVDFGHEELGRVAGDFCARWNQGVKVLVGDNEWLGDTVTEAVRTYVAVDEEASAAFAGVLADLGRAGV